MLPFKNRLVKGKDFERIQRGGRYFSHGNIAVKFVPNGMVDSRVGFSVGLRYSKLAVARNQAKGMLRDIFRGYLSKLKKGQDIDVIIRKREGEKIKAPKLAEEVEIVLLKAGLIEINSVARERQEKK